MTGPHALRDKWIVHRCVGVSLVWCARLPEVHNHPSGDPTPSRADIEMTRAVREAATLGIALHDHLIISPGGHNSLRSMGLL